MAESGQWMTGTEANNELASSTTVNSFAPAVEFASAIFGAVGANRYVQDYSFKHDDVVIEETGRDNRALIAAAATAMLLILVLIVIAVG